MILNKLKFTLSINKMAVSSSCKKFKSNWAAVCQMTSTNDRTKNLSICEDLITQAVDKNASIIFLPECFDFVGSSLEETLKMSESINGHTINFFRNIASTKSVWLSLGGFHEKIENEDSIHLSHLMIDSKGDIVSIYRKSHLFDTNLKSVLSLRESSYTKPGNAILPPVQTPIGKVGLQVCYDMRFPEVSSIQTRLGADCLTYPSAFTVPTGMAHWHVLLRARAIENQCYVIAAAQTGRHNEKRESFGHSLIVDPWGTIACECKQGNSFAIAEIDLNYVEKVRTGMPVMSHKRYDLYNKNSHKI